MLRYIAEFTSLIKEGPLKSFKTGGKHDQIRVREMTLKVVIKKDQRKKNTLEDVTLVQVRDDENIIQGSVCENDARFQ